MKRLILAAAMALVLHILLLSMKAEWLKNDDLENHEPGPLSVSLIYLLPEKKEALVISEPEHVAVKQVPAPEKKIIEKPVPRKPVKRVQPPIPALPKSSLSPVTPPVERVEVKSPIEKQSETEIPGPVVRPLTGGHPPERGAMENENIEAGIREESPAPFPQTLIPSPPLPPEPPVIVEAVPAYGHNPAPEYPGLARRRRYEGTVLLEVLVDATGMVGDIRLADSSGYTVLDQAAVKSVRSWVFKPGRRGDETIEMWVRVPVRFELR